jgi:hypothetical protein
LEVTVGVDRLLFQRPEEDVLSVERTPVAGTCAACGAENLARYPIANSMGPRIAVKCQDCFVAVSITKPEPADHWPPWASPTADWPSSRVG